MTITEHSEYSRLILEIMRDNKRAMSVKEVAVALRSPHNVKVVKVALEQLHRMGMVDFLHAIDKFKLRSVSE